MFCKPKEDLNSRIIERLDLKKHTRPNYFNSLWKIFSATPIVNDRVTNNASKTSAGYEESNETTSDNGSVFCDAFKTIRFHSIEEIKDKDLARNMYELELFFEYSLNKMDERHAADALRRLLDTFTILQFKNSRSHFGNSRQDFDILRYEALKDFIVKPILYFIGHLLLVHGKNAISSEPTYMIEKTRPSLIWDSLDASGEPYPKTLRDEEMFHSHVPDCLITLFQANASNSPVLGIHLEESELSEVLKSGKTDNFSKLSKVLRRIVPFQVFNKLNSYIISDVNSSIYFEYPLDDGEWWSDNEEEVYITGAPVRFKLFNNTGKDLVESFSLQLLLLLKIYDKIKRKLPSNLWLESLNGNVLEMGTYRSLDEGWKEDSFKPFIISQFRHGFKKNVAVDKMDQIPEEETRCSLGYAANDTGNSIKRLKVGKKLSNGTLTYEDEVAPLYLTKMFTISSSLKVSNYQLLSAYSNSISAKLLVKGSEIFKSNTNISNKVFFKMFDLANLKYLHKYINTFGMPYFEEEFKKFTESELNTLVSLDRCNFKDFKRILENLKKSFIREVTTLRRINQWNSTHEINERINSPKLLQYGWTYLELLSEGQVKYSYWGPFICTESLQFISDNEFKDNSRRTKNLNKQIKILSKAGIKHNDTKRDNVCFDNFDQAYLVDFGQSIVDDDRYLENYDLQHIGPDEKCP
ncbi:hypothetical protein BN7_585 [Wickerhamomyces ciferrii]|uniref:Protein kinase domain-containing protein n=1 Tax=Wickerhamomyces ciferrii (strain ATCC 14091 / BCRC 22168 / CBS 111 / JCM 3599 / NBRC 0793 / NRRL Y-1031 F-60-10) TaxID=1206466 RepID=K0KIQ8_WICCF|nr:uncharacterized protein BN7_585 [Wickerhamomyces ciferrii]CCH41048.1 hypothetical protein BN7_585 [Wickerhamomyces ciferrii]